MKTDICPIEIRYAMRNGLGILYALRRELVKIRECLVDLLPKNSYNY